MFRHREDAGKKLGIELSKPRLHRPVLLALLRDWTPVAAKVARTLRRRAVCLSRRGTFPARLKSPEEKEITSC